MTHDQDEYVPAGKKAWPPKPQFPSAPTPHAFLTRYTGEGKRVAWPPHLDPESQEEGEEGQGDPHAPPRGPHQNASPNMTTYYPSGFKLRNEPPMDHRTEPPVVPAQPAFKISQPTYVNADELWPPRKYREAAGQEEVRETLRPRKPNKDYTEFFAQNALPSTYPPYRAPPGTQHLIFEEE